MGSRDLIHVAVASIPVAALVVAAAVFPVYRLGDGTLVRRPLWNAPTIKVGHGEEKLAPADLERLNKDPVQREIIQRMREMPFEIKLSPIYLSVRGTGTRNVLGDLAFFSLLGFAIFVWHKWNR